MSRRNRNPPGTERNLLLSDIDNANIRNLSRPRANRSVVQNPTLDYQHPQQDFAVHDPLSANRLFYPASLPTRNDFNLVGSSESDFSMHGSMAGPEQVMRNQSAEPAASLLPPSNQQDHFLSPESPIQIQPTQLPAPGSGQSWARGMQPAAGVARFGWPQWPYPASIQQPGGPQSTSERVAFMAGPNNQLRCVTVMIAPSFPSSLISARLAGELGCNIVPCPPGVGNQMLATFSAHPIQHMASGIYIGPQWGQLPYPWARVAFYVDLSDDSTLTVILGKPILELLFSPSGGGGEVVDN